MKKQAKTTHRVKSTRLITHQGRCLAKHRYVGANPCISTTLLSQVKETKRGGARGRGRPKSDDFIDYGSDSFEEAPAPKPTRGRGRARGAAKRRRVDDFDDDDIDSLEESPAKLPRRGRGRGRAKGTTVTARGRGTSTRGRGASPGRPRGRGRASTRGRGSTRKEQLEEDGDFMVEETGGDVSRRSSRAAAGKKKDWAQLHYSDEDEYVLFSIHTSNVQRKYRIHEQF